MRRACPRGPACRCGRGEVCSRGIGPSRNGSSIMERMCDSSQGRPPRGVQATTAGGGCALGTGQARPAAAVKAPPGGSPWGRRVNAAHVIACHGRCAAKHRLAPVRARRAFARLGRRRPAARRRLRCSCPASPACRRWTATSRASRRPPSRCWRRGDFVDIRFQDEARHKKPVGIYWMQAAVVAAGEALGVPRGAHHDLALSPAVAARRDRWPCC